MGINDLGPLPTEHPRSRLCRDAEQDVLAALHAAISTYKLTPLEQMRLVNKVSSDFIGGVLKYAIRRERHGDTDKPGDIE